jgi:hypothetical protein
MDDMELTGHDVDQLDGEASEPEQKLAFSAQRDCAQHSVVSRLWRLHSHIAILGSSFPIWSHAVKLKEKRRSQGFLETL